MYSLHPADAVVLLLYLVGITGLGVWMGRKVHSASDYFMPRRFGPLMMLMHAFGTGTASDQAVVVAAQTLKSGVSGIWWQWLWLPATPFYWLIAPIMRRFRAVTTADVYALRFNHSVAVLFSLVGIANLTVKIGLLLKGSAALVDASTAGMLDANMAIAVITVLFVIYGMAGGLAAAIVTDFIQGTLTVVFSFMLLPFVLNAVGGLSGTREIIADPQMLALVSPTAKIGVFFIAMYALQALVGIVAQPFIMGVCAAGRTETDGRIGFMFGNILKRICTIAWSLTSLAAVAWYIQRGVDLAQIQPDHVYGDIARAFLPTVLPGLLGLFLATLLAGVMSSCDSMMISTSGLFTQNIYRPLVRDKPERHYLNLGRIVSLLVVAGGVTFAYWVPTVTEALDIWFKIAPMMAIAFWLGLFWRRTTSAGAWAATIGGFGAWWLTTRPWFITWIAELPIAESWTLVWQESNQPAEIYEPWVVVFYMAVAVFAGITVSLLTRPVEEERLDLFYSLTRTPITPGEVVTAPCTLPENVQVPPRPMFIQAGGLEVPMPSKTSLVGFLVGWVAVAALIGGFVLLMR